MDQGHGWISAITQYLVSEGTESDCTAFTTKLLLFGSNHVQMLTIEKYTLTSNTEVRFLLHCLYDMTKGFEDETETKESVIVISHNMSLGVQ